jgi:hypothetical protein
MAITNHRPQKFVCMECKLIHAGIPHKGSGDTVHYDPPTRCGACGETDLVLTTKYPHFQTRDLTGSL